jgi:hypothetical protein
MVKRVRRWAAAMIGVMVAVPTMLVMTSGPAQAINCAGRRTDVWVDVRSRTDVVNGRTVQLALITGRGSDYSGAQLAGNIIPGDDLWVEKKTPSGAWEACPRTTVGFQGGPVRQSDHISYNKFQTMRACMSFAVYGSYRQTLCTAEYYDT